MGANRYYRRYIQKMITANPVEITIARTTITDDGYGGEHEETVILPAQTVTIYNRRSVREVMQDGGLVAGSYISRVTKLLAMADADIQEGDEFRYEGRLWRIAFVQDCLGICKQAELEVVGR